MLETLAAQGKQLYRMVVATVEANPWAFIALAVVTLVMLIRRHRF
jgi:hypothetical protein